MSSTPDSPYKAPSKAEQNRKMLLVPLLLIPGGISGYFTFGMESSKGFSWFSYHPFFMMTAFLTLSGLSILTKKMGGRDNTMMHGYLMWAASFSAGFAAYVIWTNKEMYGKEHLTTPHGQFGALVLMMFLFYPLVAYIAYNPDNGLLKTNKLARTFHKYSGKVTVLLGLVTCCFGITSIEKDPLKSAGLIGALLCTSPFFLL